MANIGLLPTQKKQLYDLIKDVIGNNSGFNLLIEADKITINHAGGYYFQFYDTIISASSIYYRIKYFPSGGYKEHNSTGRFTFGKAITDYYKIWLKDIKDEIYCDDVWSSECEYTLLYSNLSEGRFTKEEQAALKQEIEKLKQELSEREDLKSTLTQINIKLDVLGELVSELSKTSWRDLAIGSMMTLTKDAFVPTDAIKDIGDKLMSFITEPLQKLLE